MRTIFPRTGRASALLFVAVVLGAPSLASAQLLPNLPIRRERTPCPLENPQYKMIRQEYWGYYPTCWRRFPPGWGCPSAEAPNWEAAKAKTPVDLGETPGLGPDRPRGNGANPEAGGEMAPEQPRNPPAGVKPGEPGIPPLPPDTSPFDNPPRRPTIPEGTTAPDAGAAPGDSPLPGDTPRAAAPSNANSPADAPAPLGASSPAPRRGRTLMAGFFGGRRR